jgi:prepilin-type processing-associated H-X9-DG protein
MSQQPSTAAAPLPPAAKTSGLAIASLVCGIAGVPTCGLGAIAGIILGIVGLVKIGKSGGLVGGKGISIAGIVVSAISLLLVPFIGMVVATALPAVMKAQESAHNAAEMKNMKQLCLAAHRYAADHKGQFPSSREWPEELRKYVSSDAVMARDHANTKAGLTFAMNAELGGLSQSQVRNPSQTVLFFESANPGSRRDGGRRDLGAWPRHGNGYIIGFCDGHVEDVKPDKAAMLNWDPRAP